MHESKQLSCFIVEGICNPFRLPFQHVVQETQNGVRLARGAVGKFERRQGLDEEVPLRINKACSLRIC